MAKERPDPELATRFSELAKKTGLSDTALAAELGLDSSMMGKIRSGERGLNLRAALKLCDLTGADPWLLTFGKNRSHIVSELTYIPDRHGVSVEALLGLTNAEELAEKGTILDRLRRLEANRGF